MSRQALDCQDLVELVTNYLEGVLDPATLRRFEDHLPSCDGCDTYVDQMRITLRMLGSIPVASVDAGARGQLLSTFRDWSAARGS
jgi:anti-sigma factor RsiW